MSMFFMISKFERQFQILSEWLHLNGFVVIPAIMKISQSTKSDLYGRFALMVVNELIFSH